MSFIQEGYEFLDHLTNAFKIFDVVSFVTINRLTKYVFAYSDKKLFNIFDIRCQMFHELMQ